MNETSNRGFHFAEAAIALPKGAWARTERRLLTHDGRIVLGLTQGRQRPYVYPLTTPAGFPVTSEGPADHPHHNSFWIGADHLHCRMPVEGEKFEEYTYNFYVDEVFQGRAPGRLLAGEAAFERLGPDTCRLTQAIEWRGPVEWAAPQGRLAAQETRTLDVALVDGATVIDVTSELAAAEWDFTLGPTRHAYFNVRAADTMTAANGGTVFDDRGAVGGANVTGTGARWVCAEGPVGGGHRAGLAVFPHPADHADLSWFAADWGVVTVGPFRLAGQLVRRGERLTARYRVLAFDGPADAIDLAGRFAAYTGTSA